METKMTNFQWYLANQDYLADLYEGMYVVIKDCTVIATFKEEDEAIFWSIKKFPHDDTNVQWCVKGPEAYTIDQY